MKLFADLSADYRLDARLANGQRLETDTLVGAEYTLSIKGMPVIRKTLDDGLEIRHSDDQGDGFLFVTIDNNELRYIGQARQSLIITDCQGNKTGVFLRPEFITVEEI